MGGHVETISPISHHFWQFLIDFAVSQNMAFFKKHPKHLRCHSLNYLVLRFIWVFEWYNRVIFNLNLAKILTNNHDNTDFWDRGIIYVLFLAAVRKFGYDIFLRNICVESVLCAPAASSDSSRAWYSVQPFRPETCCSSILLASAHARCHAVSLIASSRVLIFRGFLARIGNSEWFSCVYL